MTKRKMEKKTKKITKKVPKPRKNKRGSSAKKRLKISRTKRTNILFSRRPFGSPS